MSVAVPLLFPSVVKVPPHYELNPSFRCLCFQRLPMRFWLTRHFHLTAIMVAVTAEPHAVDPNTAIVESSYGDCRQKDRAKSPAIGTRRLSFYACYPVSPVVHLGARGGLCATPFGLNPELFLGASRFKTMPRRRG